MLDRHGSFPHHPPMKFRSNNQDTAEPTWTDVFGGGLASIRYFSQHRRVVLRRRQLPDQHADAVDRRRYRRRSVLRLGHDAVSGRVDHGGGEHGPLRARIGGRRSLAAGGAVFSLGALGCSMAAGIEELLVARFFQGIGGGLILAGAMAFTSVLFGRRAASHRDRGNQRDLDHRCDRRAVVQAGAFANFGWWRGAFFLYVPIGAAFLIGVLWKIPRTADQAVAGSQRLRFPIWRVGLLGLGVLCVGSSGWLTPRHCAPH